jgi:hypothetical protein
VLSHGAGVPLHLRRHVPKGGARGGRRGDGVARPRPLRAAHAARRNVRVLRQPAGAAGVVVFGDAPYAFQPGFELSDASLTYTPLLVNKLNEYFVGVTGIKVNGRAVPLNAALLTIDKKGVGGTKLSTIGALRCAGVLDPPGRHRRVRGRHGNAPAGPVRAAVQAVLRREQGREHARGSGGADHHAGAGERRRRIVGGVRCELDGRHQEG